MIKKNVLVAIDRDGTLIYDDGYFGKDDNWQKKIKIYKGGFDLIKSLNNFAHVVVASNQIGVALGLYSLERVEKINSLINSFFLKNGATIDGWYFSPYVEKKWAKENGLNLKSEWILDCFPKTRKPEIGMLEMAASSFKRDLSFYNNIFVIGDSLDDLNMALNVRGFGIFFNNKKNSSLVKKVKLIQKDNPGKIFIINNLLSALDIIKSKIKVI